MKLLPKPRAAPFLIGCALSISGVLGCARPEPPVPVVDGLRAWGEEGTAANEFKGPRAIAVDKSGLVFVADRASMLSVWKNGRFVRRWKVPLARAGSFEGPEGVAALPDGKIAVTSTHASMVYIYDHNGRLERKWGGYGTQPGRFLLATGLTADRDGFIYIADYGGHFDRISKWTREGKLVASWPGHGEGPRQFRRPCGLAIAPNGDLLVADIGNHRIQILDRETGAYKGQFGPRGRGEGQLTYPYGVAVDGRGFVYTLEYGTHRVQKWSPDYKWLASFGGPGREVGKFANPWGIAASSQGHIYVADTNNHRVQTFRFTR